MAVVLDAREIGRRLLELHRTRRTPWKVFGGLRGGLHRTEHATRGLPSLGYIEKICGMFDIGLARFCCEAERYSNLLMLEDDLVVGVLPYLKALDSKQRALILKTLEVAPKLSPTSKFANTKKRTLIESVKSIESNGSTTQCPTSRTRPLH